MKGLLKYTLFCLIMLLVFSCQKEEITPNEDVCVNVDCEEVSNNLNEVFGFFSMIWFDIENPIINGTGQPMSNIAGEMVPNGELINHNSDGTLKQSVRNFLLEKAGERDDLIFVLDSCCGGHELYWSTWYDNYWYV